MSEHCLIVKCGGPQKLPKRTYTVSNTIPAKAAPAKKVGKK